MLFRSAVLLRVNKQPTANPVEVIVAESEQGRGILGVIDGSSPKGIENEADKQWRHDLLRKISYKR